jgi:hypothetical protein
MTSRDRERLNGEVRLSESTADGMWGLGCTSESRGVEKRSERARR